MPEIVFVEVDPVLGRSEPDPEIQPLIVNSGGRNLGLDYLPGRHNYHPVATPRRAGLASLVVWLDAYVTNVDRTVRNPNLLLWHKRIWLIDHGAALYFHYSWETRRSRERARDPFPQIARHVLLPYATALPEADALATARLTPDVIRAVVALIPDDWLDEPTFPTPDAHRDAYAATWPIPHDRLTRPRAVPGDGHRERSADARAQTFDYAIVRVVPRVEREEFVNAGVIVFCRPLEFLGALVELDRDRLAAPSTRTPTPTGGAPPGAPSPGSAPAAPPPAPSGASPSPSASTGSPSPAAPSIQTSPVHSGLGADPRGVLDHLLKAMVRPPRAR